MTLIGKNSKIIPGRYDAVLDKIEEPEMLLKQAIREMAKPSPTRNRPSAYAKTNGNS